MSIHCNHIEDVSCLSRREALLRRDPETKFKVVKRKIILAQNVMLPKVVNTFF